MYVVKEVFNMKKSIQLMLLILISFQFSCKDDLQNKESDNSENREDKEGIEKKDSELYKLSYSQIGVSLLSEDTLIEIPVSDSNSDDWNLIVTPISFGYGFEPEDMPTDESRFHYLNIEVSKAGPRHFKVSKTFNYTNSNNHTVKNKLIKINYLFVRSIINTKNKFVNFKETDRVKELVDEKGALEVSRKGKITVDGTHEIPLPDGKTDDWTLILSPVSLGANDRFSLDNHHSEFKINVDLTEHSKYKIIADDFFRGRSKSIGIDYLLVRRYIPYQSDSLLISQTRFTNIGSEKNDIQTFVTPDSSNIAFWSYIFTPLKVGARGEGYNLKILKYDLWVEDSQSSNYVKLNSATSFTYYDIKGKVNIGCSISNSFVRKYYSK